MSLKKALEEQAAAASTVDRVAHFKYLKNYYESRQIKHEGWYLNGVFHRAGGPAIIWYYESGQISYGT